MSTRSCKGGSGGGEEEERKGASSASASPEDRSGQPGGTATPPQASASPGGPSAGDGSTRRGNPPAPPATPASRGSARTEEDRLCTPTPLVRPPSGGPVAHPATSMSASSATPPPSFGACLLSGTGARVVVGMRATPSVAQSRPRRILSSPAPVRRDALRVRREAPQVVPEAAPSPRVAPGARPYPGPCAPGDVRSAALQGPDERHVLVRWERRKTARAHIVSRAHPQVRPVDVRVPIGIDIRRLVAVAHGRRVGRPVIHLDDTAYGIRAQGELNHQPVGKDVGVGIGVGQPPRPP